MGRGALSDGGGRARIIWRTDEGAEGKSPDLRREERGTAREIGGAVAIRYDPAG